jgi:hypothetical protein
VLSCAKCDHIAHVAHSDRHTDTGTHTHTHTLTLTGTLKLIKTLMRSSCAHRALTLITIMRAHIARRSIITRKPLLIYSIIRLDEGGDLVRFFFDLMVCRSAGYFDFFLQKRPFRRAGVRASRSSRRETLAKNESANSEVELEVQLQLQEPSDDEHSGGSACKEHSG